MLDAVNVAAKDAAVLGSSLPPMFCFSTTAPGAWSKNVVTSCAETTGCAEIRWENDENDFLGCPRHRLQATTLAGVQGCERAWQTRLTRGPAEAVIEHTIS